jgi:hypothetical protein
LYPLGKSNEHSAAHAPIGVDSVAASWRPFRRALFLCDRQPWRA